MPNQNKNQTSQQKAQEASVQAFLDIAEIKDNIVVLKDGGLRAVLLVSAINFDLKSAQEQDTIIYSYQNFLNSLNFPVQIVVKSKKLDIDLYLNRIEGHLAEQTNEFLQEQTKRYADFIKRLVELTNIMHKRFYLIVPFTPKAIENIGFVQKIMSSLNPTWRPSAGTEGFETNKTQLKERVNLVIDGLSTLGLRAAELTTQDIIELFYTIYNPTTAKNEKILDDIANLSAPIIKGPEEKE